MTTIAEAIERLQSLPNKDDEIIIAWWDQDAFDYEGEWSEDEWAEFVGIAEDRMDWSNTHEQIEYTVDSRRDD